MHTRAWPTSFILILDHFELGEQLRFLATSQQRSSWTYYRSIASSPRPIMLNLDYFHFWLCFQQIISRILFSKLIKQFPRSTGCTFALVRPQYFSKTTSKKGRHFLLFRSVQVSILGWLVFFAVVAGAGAGLFNESPGWLRRKFLPFSQEYLVLTLKQE